MKTYKPKDHADWLEFRRQHLTSTELAKLHLTKTARTWQELRDEKETGQSHFTGNVYTVWGSAREPLLAMKAVTVDSRLVYNGDPQTIVINPHDDRLCGTPDLFSEDGEVIGEIKTSGVDFNGGRYHQWAPDPYYLQCQLNMHYTGAEACVLLVEYRDDTESGFTPRAAEYRTLTPNATVVEELMLTATEWFAWLDGHTPEWMGEVDGLDQMDELTEAVEGFLDADKKAKTWAEVAKAYKQQIYGLVGGSYSGEVAGHMLSVSVLGPAKTFDTVAFKKAHPDMFQEFKTKERAGYTRITLKEVS